ncbi:flagellar hook-associated protein FlgK [Methylobacterium nodulans]|uniref:Flagellar hook-associated protein 1 n=1 Tax=Methylobacterium nodulans (strain LMG 21967 / CNCM I-2342 / ORS 2060) TaxID=460265 RepID=B8IB72_METNO|nr:flagellar hook-associated protein FlgK [Methylobacterium nodulans]ACL57287.1 flagellar hook-associated protein FlgK [Methylobacterium nodulans ORS 2060]
MALNALNTATAGLQVTQAAIGIVSQNVANQSTPGYVKRTLTPVSQSGNAGVGTGTVTRVLDAAAQKQLRLETSGAAYTDLVASIHSQIDALYGTPGSEAALDGVVNAFAQSLQSLASDPSSAPNRSTVLSDAGRLANRISDVANGVQELRTGLESRLGADVASASKLLSEIAALNVKIVGSTGSGGGDSLAAELLDQRDQRITELAQSMDVQTNAVGDGSVTVLTSSGVTLVDHGSAATLAFDGRSQLGPSAVYSTDASMRGVGTITATTPSGARIDLVADKAIRSGSIAAALTLRDDTLVQAQRQLDDLAAGLSRAMSDRNVSGTAATGEGGSGFDIDLTGLQAGNTVTLALRTSGVARNVILMPTMGNAPAAIDPNLMDDPTALVVPFDIAGGPSTFAGAIASALGTGFAVSAAPSGGAGAVRILASGLTLTGATASITVPTSATDTRNGAEQLPLFVDSGSGNSVYTGSFEGGSHLTGLAQRLTVNPALMADTSSLIGYAGTTGAGDAKRPSFLYDALTGRSRTFSAASGIGGISAPYSTSVQDFAQSIIDAQGAAAAQAQQLDEGQKIALSTAQSRFGTQSGVNIDEELSRLIQLQSAYAANARVLTAAKDMIDTLMRI